MGLSTERRKYHRFKYEIAISHDILSPELTYAGQLMNFSEGGLYFESDQTLYSGEEINIWIKSPLQIVDNDPRLLVGAEIIWRQNVYGAAFRYGYGAAFIGLANPLMKNIESIQQAEKRLRNKDLQPEKEAREYPRRRYQKPLPFIYQNHRLKGWVTDISRGGVFIETFHKCSLGKTVRLIIPGNTLRKAAGVKGWVVRMNTKGVGVKFDRRSGRERRSDLDRRTGLDRRRGGRPRAASR